MQIHQVWMQRTNCRVDRIGVYETSSGSDFRLEVLIGKRRHRFSLKPYRARNTVLLASELVDLRRRSADAAAV